MTHCKSHQNSSYLLSQIEMLLYQLFQLMGRRRKSEKKLSHSRKSREKGGEMSGRKKKRLFREDKRCRKTYREKGGNGLSFSPHFFCNLNARAAAKVLSSLGTTLGKNLRFSRGSNKRIKECFTYTVLKILFDLKIKAKCITLRLSSLQSLLLLPPFIFYSQVQTYYKSSRYE